MDVQKMVVNYKEYEELKKRFFEKHDYNYSIETSQMDEYGCYHKEYIFEDGNIWHESYRPTYEKAVVEIKKVSVEVEVKMFCTEFWNTEDSKSKCMYEKF